MEYSPGPVQFGSVQNSQVQNIFYTFHTQPESLEAAQHLPGAHPTRKKKNSHKWLSFVKTVYLLSFTHELRVKQEEVWDISSSSIHHTCMAAELTVKLPLTETVGLHHLTEHLIS